MQSGLDQYLADFVPCLHDVLRNEKIHRDIKLPAFHALGDLSLNSGDSFNDAYLHDTLTILDMAAQMTTQPENHPSPNMEADYAEFIRELRDEILVQYSTILISVSESEQARTKQSFQQHLGVICDFLAKSLDIYGTTDHNLLKQAAGLVMDLAQLFNDNAQLKTALMAPRIEGLLNALHGYADQESKETATGAYESVARMCSATTA